MFGLETFHIVFIVVLLVVVLLVRFFMNRAMDEARKNGIVDNGLGFDAINSSDVNYNADPKYSILPSNIHHRD